ncbi:hypothetical protein AP077_22895 [Salmonella enterica]|nr:hypothetical protein [Salmonella enterica]EBP7969284.1 hypothetical protein [Salmonella enterica]
MANLIPTMGYYACDVTRIKNLASAGFSFMDSRRQEDKVRGVMRSLHVPAGRKAHTGRTTI